ncbi:MAG: glycosyl transferase [Alphaproteobacteria bacterium]|nr:glycosyl transferase [Alphaproteobacteria bacterium]
MQTPRLSALVVAHNEEDQLGDCLTALRFADEIVVVLDRCTDRSEDVAQAHGAKIEAGAWEIEGARRNRGIEICSGDWILEVDADERITDALAENIRSAIAVAPYGYFLIPYHNYVGDRLVEFGWGASWGVSATVRLFAKNTVLGPAKIWGDQRIHPALELKGEPGRLEVPMLHFVDRNISDMIHRLDRYTSARARDLRESGELGSFGRNVRRIFSRFWKCYVSRRGYREGQYGFLIALMAGLYPILSYLKAHLEDD